MTENLEARARQEVSRPAWQRNSPKDNIPDLTRRGARQPQDGIARGDVPARDARGVWPPRPAQPRDASMRPDDARVRANTLGPVRNEQRWKEISPREIGQDGRGAQGDEQGLRVRLRVRVRVQVRPRVRRAGARRQDRQDRRALRHPPHPHPHPHPPPPPDSRNGGPRLARSTEAPSPHSAAPRSSPTASYPTSSTSPHSSVPCTRRVRSTRRRRW